MQDKIERLNSGTYTGNDSSPRKVLLEQLSKTLPADDVLPDQVIDQLNNKLFDRFKNR